MPSYRVGEAQEIDFKDYAPDLSPTTPGILLGMDGYVPTVKGYATRPTPVTVAAALPDGGVPRGGFVALFSTGETKIFAGTKNNLYRLDAGLWTNIGTGYSIQGRWRFAQFGDDVIAVAANQAPQVTTGPSGTFAALAGGPPFGANTVVSVSSLVFMTQGSNWYNAAIGVDNDWNPNIQTLAAQGTFTDFPGPVVGMAPLFRNIIIFKQGSMLLGQLVGGESVWNFQLLSDETGTQVQESIILLPEAVAFLGADDFYITTGNTPQRIPNNLKEWFFQNADPDQLQNMLAWYDHKNSIAYWHFVSKTPPILGVCDLWVALNVRAGRWATGKLSTFYVFPNTQSGEDSGLFFDSNKVLKSWTGAPGQAFVKTGYLGDPGKMTQVMRVRPKYNVYPTGTPMPDLVIPFHTDVLGKPPTQDLSAARGNDGWHYFRSYDRYHQVQINTNGEAEIVGAAAELRVGGVR